MILVSLASWPPITTTSPPTKVVAPPPLEARGRSGMLDQVPSATSKQSTRAVVGERPPATHTAPPSTKPIRWFRGWGSGGSTVQRSEEHTSELQSQFHLVCRLLLEK